MRIPAILLIPLCLAAVLVACGGDDDDFSDIQATATARAASNSPTTAETATEGPSPTPTVGQANPADYIADVRQGYDTLKTDLKTLIDDMFAAQQNQSDPNTPIILQTDIQAVNDSVAALRELETPESLAEFETDLNAALDEIEKGTSSLQRAIETQSQEEGAAAFLALQTGEGMLDEAIASLPQ